jgi:hypothetical protein
MSEPIFVLGSHRSGTSVVAGLLYRACGVSMGELMPPTEDTPMGSYEALGVVEAHRDLLVQLERDWTCPPTTFRPGLLDLSALEEQVKIHNDLPGVWAMKDPRSMFLLPAWNALGIERVRLVAVVRPPADTIRSIEKRDHIRQDRAEAIVDAYLRRLLEIASKVPLPVIQFPGDGDSVINQVRDLAVSLDLPWNEEEAQAFFDEKLVRNRSPLRDFSPTYESLLEKARFPTKVPVVNLRTLRLTSEPEWPLETHIGVRYAQQRNQLWDMAHFSSDPEPHVVEIVLEGAQPGLRRRPGITLDQVEVKSPLGVGAALIRDMGRPHGVIAHGLLAGRSFSEIEFFFRSIYVNTDPFAELLVDVPDPRGKRLLNSTPSPIDHPRPERVQELGEQCGWDHVVTERLSPGRSGMFFRKRVLTDNELVPVVSDLISSLHRIHAIEARLSATQNRLRAERVPITSDAPRPNESAPDTLEAERARAEAAERELERLRSRRSVRLALAMARPWRGVFRAVRSWKKSR